MKKKILSIIILCCMTLSFVACSNDKNYDKLDDKDSQSNENASEIYEFTVNIFGNIYSLPCELNIFTNNGWEYKDNNNPESNNVNENRHAYSDMIKDGKIITITVHNSDKETKKFADCKVDSLYCEFSVNNDLTLNLANKLSANKDTTIEDVTKKFGVATKTLNDKGGTTIRYQKDIYVYYIFTFNTEGRLTSVDIRNRVKDN